MNRIPKTTNAIRLAAQLPSIIPSLRTRPLFPTPRRQQQQLLRLYSDSKPMSNHANFYKTFGRPIFKVVLMAVFVYQLAYYGWVKLEQDEIKSEMTATIAALEAKIERLERTIPHRKS